MTLVSRAEDAILILSFSCPPHGLEKKRGDNSHRAGEKEVAKEKRSRACCHTNGQWQPRDSETPFFLMSSPWATVQAATQVGAREKNNLCSYLKTNNKMITRESETERSRSHSCRKHHLASFSEYLRCSESFGFFPLQCERNIDRADLDVISPYATYNCYHSTNLATLCSVGCLAALRTDAHVLTPRTYFTGILKRDHATKLTRYALQPVKQTRVQACSPLLQGEVSQAVKQCKWLSLCLPFPS